MPCLQIPKIKALNNNGMTMIVPPKTRLSEDSASPGPDATTDSMTVEQAVSDLAKQSWMKLNRITESGRVLSANELTSISALIAYVASESGQNEFAIERRLADRFNIPNVTRMPADQYDSAIRYLVDSLEEAGG